MAVVAARRNLLNDLKQLIAAGEAGEISFVDVTETALCSTYDLHLGDAGLQFVRYGLKARFAPSKSTDGVACSASPRLPAWVATPCQCLV